MDDYQWFWIFLSTRRRMRERMILGRITPTKRRKSILSRNQTRLCQRM